MHNCPTEDLVEITNSFSVFNYAWKLRSVMYVLNSSVVNTIQDALFHCQYFSPISASAPDFSRNPMKKMIQVQIGSTVDFECKPKASPKARCSWKKGGEQLHENERYQIYIGLFVLIEKKNKPTPKIIFHSVASSVDPYSCEPL